MKYITEDEFNSRMEIIQKENVTKERKRKLKEEKNKYKLILRTSKIETNKLIAIYLFALLNVIVIYAMVAMWKFADLSYLGILISDIAAQVVIYAIYCLKAYNGKKQEEQMKFEREKISYNFDNVLDVDKKINGDYDVDLTDDVVG